MLLSIAATVIFLGESKHKESKQAHALPCRRNPQLQHKAPLMATQRATENYFTRIKSLPASATVTLGKTGFRVCKIGFGGYRIHHNSIEHARALRYALLNGFNLIDTSSNYGDGGSEMLIGNILGEMIERGELHRDEVVIVSKVGYVQGQNLELAQKHERDGQPFPDMVKYADGCWHCIHPEFLEDQLSRSLERLNQPFLDIYLLHNPEYFLSDRKNRNGARLEDSRTEYYRRIRLAFEWMEDKVAEGKIKGYGISSNTFALPETAFDFTSLEKTLEIAQSISQRHFFRVIQFPFNPFETAARSERNQDGGRYTVLEYARANQLATLVNRPLNAITGEAMVRLASFRENPPEDVRAAFDSCMQSLIKLEQQFRDEFLTAMPTEVPRETFKEIFSHAHLLRDALSQFQTWEHWDHVRQNVLVPQMFSTLNYLRDPLKQNYEWRAWTNIYTKTGTQFFDIISQHYENQAQQRSQTIGDILANADADLRQSETLSQKVLRLLTAVEGVDCVLLGMRKTPYVEDAFAALQQPPLHDAAAVLTKFQAEIEKRSPLT